MGWRREARRWGVLDGEEENCGQASRVWEPHWSLLRVRWAVTWLTPSCLRKRWGAGSSRRLCGVLVMEAAGQGSASSQGIW